MKYSSFVKVSLSLGSWGDFDVSFGGGRIEECIPFICTVYHLSVLWEKCFVFQKRRLLTLWYFSCKRHLLYKVCACVVIRSLLNNVTIVCVVSYCMYLNIQIVYLDPNATPYLSLDYSPWDSNSLSRQFTLYFHICGTCSVCKLLFWRWSDDQYQSSL